MKSRRSAGSESRASSIACSKSISPLDPYIARGRYRTLPKVRLEVRLSPPPPLVLSRRVDPSGPVNSSTPRGRVRRGDAELHPAAEGRFSGAEAPDGCFTEGALVIRSIRVI